MSGRKWLVRGLVFSVLGGLAAAGVVYERWTNPTAVRQQVLAQLETRFPGASVTLGSAQLRLLGGIAVEDLRLARHDDRDRTEFAYVPSAIIYHDKEQLLDGKLVVRKLELHRPRLHVIRRPDGTWNLSGLVRPAKPTEPLPTVVIQEGTLLLEDRLASPGTPPIEIRNVNLTFVNDPAYLVTVRADAISDLTGALEATASWQRESGEVALTLQGPAVSIQPPLIRRLTAYCPEIGEHAQQLAATATVRLELGYHPGSSHPWSHDLTVQLTDGSFRHPQLPLALDHLAASVHCRDGRLSVDRCTAQSGLTCMELTASADQPSTDTDFSGVVKVTHLPLSPDFFARSPATVQQIQHDFAPSGPIDMTFTFGRKAGQWHKHCIIQLVDLVATFRHFPYPLQHLTGKLDFEIDPTQQREDASYIGGLEVDLVGYAGTRPVTIKGKVRGSGNNADIALDIRGTDIPISETVLEALPKTPVDYQDLARSFHAKGLIDFVALIRHTPGNGPYANRYWVKFHDAMAQYDVFAYPLENLSGVLDIQPDHWEFGGFRGTHKGCEILISGRSHQGPHKDRLEIHLRGSNVLLDEELEHYIAKRSNDLAQTWKTLSPSGRIDFTTQVTCLPNDPHPDIDLTLTAHNCAIHPTFFPCDLNNLTGNLRYANGWVALGQFQAQHGASAFSLDKGYVYLKPQGGYWAKLVNVRGDPVVLDRSLVHALPVPLQEVCKTLALQDPINLKTQLVVESTPERLAPPTVWWDAVVGLQNARIRTGVQLEGITGEVGCLGLHDGHALQGMSLTLLLKRLALFGQSFEDVHGRFEITKEKPDVLSTPGLQARLYGGDVGGQILVELGSTVRYEMDLTGLGVQLEEFGRHNNLGPNAQMKGLAKGRLWLRGQGADLRNLEGNGSLDVPSGRLYNLPLLLDLLKVPGLRAPDRTAFEEAHAVFAIRGTRVALSRVDLFGNAISLSGQGEMNLDGSDINLDFYAVWGRVVQFLPRLLDRIPPAISKQLLKIKMRGRLGDVHCTEEPVPVLVEPLKELLERLAGRHKPPDRGPP